MSLKLKVSMALFLNFIILSAYAQDVSVDLRMPSKYFIPGSVFSIDAVIHNTGETYPNAKLFGALTIGTGDYWFYPSWTHYLEGIDWETKMFEALSDQTVSILPAFPWPIGAGDFSGALIISAVLSETGDLISNVEAIEFGWLSIPVIDSVYPASAPPGKPLKLIGHGLNYPDFTPFVEIGSQILVVTQNGIDESGNDFVLTEVPFLEPSQHFVTITVNGHKSQPVMVSIEDIAPTGKLPTATTFVPTPTIAAPKTAPIRTQISGAITPVRTPTWTPSVGPGTPTPTPEPFAGFVYIAPGSFTMGSPSGEACRESNETQHQVILTRGINMMRTEVTRQMWADLKAVQPTLPNDPSDITVSPTMNHPVQQNTWYESILFANLMSVQNGHTRCYYIDAEFLTPVDATNYSWGHHCYCNFNANGYRLPTESEWEFACRAGTTGPFSCSEPNFTESTCNAACTAGILPTLEQYSVYCANDSGTTAVVGSKVPNPAGLYDIHGNVWESCWDWYSAYPSPSATDYTGPASGSSRVARGGSWGNNARYCRSAYRGSCTPGIRSNGLGFRLLSSASSSPVTPAPTSTVPTMTPTRTQTSGPGTPTRTPFPTPTPTPTPPPAPTGFVYIAPGSFSMGSPSDEPCHFTEETRHPVTLTRGINMMRTEVTRQMWADLKAVQPTLPNDPSDITVSPTMNHPVQQNTWYESILFANLMSVQNGHTRCYYKGVGFTIPVDATNYTSGTFFCNFNANGYRLPTEAEWEFACRSGTTTPFSCDEPNYTGGNCVSCTAGVHPTLEQHCVYCANDPGGTAVVGSKMPNQAGLYDIHGNVMEWCWDWYGPYPFGGLTDPQGPGTGSLRVFRGGGWTGDARDCRSANRNWNSPAFRFNYVGFRLIRTVN